jgi:cysteine desulfuration protein SufE
MFDTCIDRQDEIKKKFLICKTLDESYNKIISLGREQIPLTDDQKITATDVIGCQSKMLLFSKFEEGKVYFQTESDALISAGLGVLLTEVYSGETPESILKCPPTYLEELGVANALSPNRANGLASLHLTMKQIALKFLVGKE